MQREMLVAAQHRSSVLTYTGSSDMQSLVTRSFHRYRHTIPKAASDPDPAPGAGLEQTDPTLPQGISQPLFNTMSNLIFETCCHIQALTWAYKNVWKAFIRTTPAPQRYALLTMFYEESK